jgi:hypothetical protein
MVHEVTPLQQVEVFHIALLRQLMARLPVGSLALKGGCNLRWYFGSERYSEDVDLDVEGVEVFALRDKVLGVLASRSLAHALRRFAIERTTVKVAKETETVQRFKVHLETGGGADLPTKIELSRRGLEQGVEVSPVRPEVLGQYQLPPLIAPHYGAAAAVRQKIRALGSRTEPQPRDVFDLHVLSSQLAPGDLRRTRLGSALLSKAHRRALEMGYRHYRDAVVAFLAPEAQERYRSEAVWDEIRLVAAELIEGHDGG